jgi:hypothetical protein
MLPDKLSGKKTVVPDSYLFVPDNVHDRPLIFKLRQGLGVIGLTTFTQNRRGEAKFWWGWTLHLTSPLLYYFTVYHLTILLVRGRVLHSIQNIEFYSTTIYIFMILEYNKLSRHNNQALQEHKMK